MNEGFLFASDWKTISQIFFCGDEILATTDFLFFCFLKGGVICHRHLSSVDDDDDDGNDDDDDEDDHGDVEGVNDEDDDCDEEDDNVKNDDLSIR